MMRLLKYVLRHTPIQLSLWLLNFIGMILPEVVRANLRAWWYRSRYDGRLVDFGNVAYHLHPRDVVSQMIFVNGIFDSEVFATLCYLAPHCKAYIDVGANIGAMAVSIGQATNLPLYVIEPVSQNFYLLQKNLELNHLSTRSKLINYAVGSQNDHIPIYLSENNYGDHRLTISDTEDRTVEYVNVTTLDYIRQQYIKESAPYLIKIDVQGFEPFVLQGAQELLKEPCIIVTEVWAHGLVTANSSIAEFEKMYQSFGLTAYHLPRHTQQKWQVIDDLRTLFSAEDEYQHIDILLTNMDVSKFVS